MNKDLEDRLLRIWGPMPPNQVAEIVKCLEGMMQEKGRTPAQVVEELRQRQLDYLGIPA
jgi:hypothetical protein